MEVKIADTQKDRNTAFQIRKIVFIDEQHVPPEEELDHYDKEAIHFIGLMQNTPIAVGRLRFVDDYGKLERICVLKEHRGKSYGKILMDKMEETILENRLKKAKLDAQTHAEGFYNRLGYQTVSEEFMDAGIPHVTMVKHIPSEK